MNNAPIYPEYVLINFRQLIKNRFGPFKIVVRRDDGKYLHSNNRWVDKLSNAYVYYTSLTLAFSPVSAYSPFKDVAKFGGKIYLATLTGCNIELQKSNFFPKFQER